MSSRIVLIFGLLMGVFLGRYFNFNQAKEDITKYKNRS